MELNTEPQPRKRYVPTGRPPGRPKGAKAKTPQYSPKTIVMGEEHRAKIYSAGVLNRLLEFFHGKIELTDRQISVGLALLRKVMPDLTSTHVTGQADVRLQLERIERVILDPMPTQPVIEGTTVSPDPGDTAVQ